MIGIAIAALLAPVQDTQQMMVRAQTEEFAVLEFEESCMAGGLYNRAAVIRAASASPRKYGEPALGPEATVTSWNSSWGSLHYVQPAPGTKAESFPQCNMTAFTRNPVNRKSLDKALGDMIDRKVRSKVTETHRGTHVAWSWADSEGRPVTLISVLDRKTPQQITLSLQSVQGPQ
jgi:hypothetical protein